MALPTSFEQLHKAYSTHFWVQAFVQFLAGMLLTFAFSPYNFWPVLFISFPIFLSAARVASSPRILAWLGWWAGFGFFLNGLYWIGESFKQQSNVPAELAPIAILMMTALLAFYWATQFRWFGALRRSTWLDPFLFAALFVGFEVLRGYLFTGFPWNLMGTLWSDWLWVAQSARYLGVFGLSYLTVLFALAPYLIFTSIKNRAFIGTGTALVPVIVLGGFTAFGAVQLKENPTEFHLDVSMRLVQANVSQKEKWEPSLIDDHFAKHIRLSRGNTPIGRVPGVRLMIWPEVSVQRWEFNREASLQRYQLSRLMEPGSYALTGGRRYERADDDLKFYNSLFAVSARGQILETYDKNHLVPFGEYLPFYPLLSAVGLDALTGGAGLSAGEERKAIALPGIPPFVPLICYEVVFPGQARANEGTTNPAWLLTITNDAWFGQSIGPYQHFAQARMRAIEEGLPVVRAASTGISAVIDDYGRIIDQLGVGQQDVLDAPLPRKTSNELLISSSYKVLLIVMLILIQIIYALINRKTILKQ